MGMSGRGHGQGRGRTQGRVETHAAKDGPQLPRWEGQGQRHSARFDERIFDLSGVVPASKRPATVHPTMSEVRSITFFGHRQSHVVVISNPRMQEAIICEVQKRSSYRL